MLPEDGTVLTKHVGAVAKENKEVYNSVHFVGYSLPTNSFHYTVLRRVESFYDKRSTLSKRIDVYYNNI
jgi:hypothetical protein